MIITISGTPGSGKSTIAKAVAEEFHLKHYSTGDFLRSIAKKRNCSLLELSKLAESDKSIDKEVDDMSLGLKNKDNFIIDSRLAFHFLPKSLKILVKCNPKVAAERILKDALDNKRATESEIKTFNDAVKLTNARLKSEKLRYKKYYNLDYTKESNYDFVIDTSNMNKKEAIDKTIAEVKKHLKKQ